MMDKPSLGTTPAWLCASIRIADLAGAIQRCAEDEHGADRRWLIRRWAEELIMQLDIWDWASKDYPSGVEK